MGAPVQPSFTQTSFRYRNDDGSQTTATWIAATNVEASPFKPYQRFRLRFLISQTVSNANTNLARTFKLRYSLNNAAYVDVSEQNTFTAPLRMADSPNLTDGEATTQQIGSGTFVAGAVEETNATPTITFTSGSLSSTEIEFVVEIYGGQINSGDTLDLRVFETNNTALANYTNTPSPKRRGRKLVLG
jgi:hypothetical protein